MTENGIQTNVAPVVLDESDKFFSSLMMREHKNKEVGNLMKLLSSLKNYDSIKNRRQAHRVAGEKEKTLKDIKDILSSTESN